MVFKNGTIALLLITLLFSCNKGYNQEKANSELEDTKQLEPEKLGLSKSDYDLKPEESSHVLSPKSHPTKIIKTGSLGIETEHYQVFKSQVYLLTRKFGGYVANENERKDEHSIRNDLKIRLPNAYFDQMIIELEKSKGLGKLDYKKVSAIDISQEYYDIVVRVKTKKEIEKRYITILGQAKTIKDILDVENDLRVIREEIEAKEGRLRYLKDQVGKSTLEIYLHQHFEKGKERDSSNHFWPQLKKAFIAGFEGIKSLILGLTLVWPILILGLIGLWVFKKRWSQRKKQ